MTDKICTYCGQDGHRASACPRRISDAIGHNARTYPRTLEQAFGPHTDRSQLEPMREAPRISLAEVVFYLTAAAAIGSVLMDVFVWRS